jgi:two-component system chemotaxis response regulator CheY
MFPPSTRILVVDDFAPMRRIVQLALQGSRLGPADEAQDGSEAWMKIQEAILLGHPYGLVISDWAMHGMDGLELVRKIRANEQTRELPVLMVSSETDERLVTEATRAGISFFLRKPFDPAHFRDALKNTFFIHASR